MFESTNRPSCSSSPPKGCFFHETLMGSTQHDLHVFPTRCSKAHHWGVIQIDVCWLKTIYESKQIESQACTINPILCWWTKFMGKNKMYGSYTLITSFPSRNCLQVTLQKPWSPGCMARPCKKDCNLLLRPYLCNIVYGTARANMFCIFMCIHTYIAQHNRT